MVLQWDEALNMLGCYYDNDVCPIKEFIGRLRRVLDGGEGRR